MGISSEGSEAEECCHSLGQTPAAHIVEQTDAYDMAAMKTAVTIQVRATFCPSTGARELYAQKKDLQSALRRRIGEAGVPRHGLLLLEFVVFEFLEADGFHGQAEVARADVG